MRIGLIELIELYDKAIFKPLHFANYFTYISTVYTSVGNFTCAGFDSGWHLVLLYFRFYVSRAL